MITLSTSANNPKRKNIMAISDVQLKGNWYAVFDASGKKIKDLAESSVGELCGNGSDVIAFQNGAWYGIYDENGRKIKDLAVSSVGDFRNASGSPFHSKRATSLPPTTRPERS